MAMTLIVLAATMGNKYGGLKQLEGIGPNGETILDFSIYDAVRVGFNKIVFVISRHFEQEFKKLVSGKYEHVVEVEYVYQDVKRFLKKSVIEAQSTVRFGKSCSDGRRVD